MKTLNIKFLVFALVASMACMASCKKDSDTVNVETDSLVGLWGVDEGGALVYVEGNLLADVEITTGGTLKFNADGTGEADFSITFMGETDEAKGPFTWERDGFELIIDKGGEGERWVMIDDEKSLKTIQYTHYGEEEEMEVEFTLTLNKK